MPNPPPTTPVVETAEPAPTAVERCTTETTIHHPANIALVRLLAGRRPRSTAPPRSLAMARIMLDKKKAEATAPTELLTVQDAADFTKVSTQTVRRWIKAGLKIYRAGRQLRIDNSNLVDFLSFQSDE